VLVCRADHRRRAKCLDRRKALDDRVSAGDLRVPIERSADDRGESGRYRNDRERHTSDEQRVERLTADQPEQDDQQNATQAIAVMIFDRLSAVSVVASYRPRSRAGPRWLISVSIRSR
jgi:hypothetical protein